jgi:hypothetical protein
MVKPRGKKQVEELSLAAIAKQKGVSKSKSGKISKKTAESSNNAVVKAKQSRKRLKEQVAVISTPEGP